MAEVSPPTATNYQSRAEWVVGHQLSDALDHEYKVLHHRVFTVAKPSDGRLEPTVEIDVLVMHPDRGVLVIEVKGGTISAANGLLYSGSKRLAPQPHEQVEQQRRALIDHLKSNAPDVVPGNDWQALITWAIAFPGDTNGDRNAFLPTVSSRDRILWPEVFKSGAADALRKAVEAAFGADPLRAKFQGLGGWQESVRICTSDGDLRERLGPRLKFIDKEINRLTEVQSATLGALGDSKRVLITGPAGSGKTVLAWEKATLLAKADRRVLLVAYDPRAINVFDATTTNGNITAQTVEELCLTVAGEDFDPSDLSAHDPIWYGRSLADALEVGALRLSPAERYDDLIIDEVFDMWPRILGALRGLLRDEADACIWLFGDSRQGVTWGGQSQ